ncbi:MAG: ornithine carbamoyltransferase [Desulfonatronovibrionaceae bacterium]
MVNHLLSILDMPCSAAHEALKRAGEFKSGTRKALFLQGKNIVLVFEKSSTRTRVSFEVGISQAGGDCVFMTPNESQLGRSEPLKDTARVLSRYADGLVVRTFGQNKLQELAYYSDIPVINALTDMYHPCQVMSDLLTISERGKGFPELKIAWVGDGNNMAHSWINAAIYFPFQLNMAVPKGYEPDPEILSSALQAGAKIFLTHDPREAVQEAEYINTDVWASMGQEGEQEKREKAFSGFQINRDLLREAASGAKVLHCLPAHRGEEISEEVLEGEHSIVWDQAENRLHMQKALMQWVFDGFEVR